MTKKQLGIICTLLALIVCTALLAAKLNNGGLNDPSDLSTVLSTEDKNQSDKEDKKDTETLSQTDFFLDARSEREQKDAATIQSLKSISENANTTSEQKASATSELQKVTIKQDKQKTIELNLKNKGYDDALCEISNDQKKANVIVKTANSVSEKEGAEIQEIVQNAANIKEVSIEVKK
ncbi:MULTISPECIES: SpoIIIAH-like family protein [Clostridium]|uniref:SpoIIIAH-like family protein n=1 Tax=Clostridium cibarium TaxID=2762247 RepID=A0ABR8PPG6_9CLOT|nr:MULTISPECIES: SpoIIIAH-like family protein [Clostridium]MBD7910015.1 SpoIIIAH-like family protein [Clostridium cibarium]